MLGIAKAVHCPVPLSPSFGLVEKVTNVSWLITTVPGRLSKMGHFRHQSVTWAYIETDVEQKSKPVVNE